MWEFIFKNSGSNGDDRSPPVHLWFSPQTQVSISFHYNNKFICFSICLFDMCYKSSWQVCDAWPTRSGQEQHCQQPPWLRQPGQPWQEEEQEEGSFCCWTRAALKNQDDLIQVFSLVKYQKHHFHDKCRSTGNFLGKTNSPNITVVDTPGFKVGLSFILHPKTFQFSILNVCRTSATQSLWRSWWMFLETRSKRLKTSMCTRNYVILMFQNRSKRSRALWLFTNTKTGSQVPSQGHSGWSPKCLVRLWNICFQTWNMTLIQETSGPMLWSWSTFGVSTLFMWRTGWTRGWV